MKKYLLIFLALSFFLVFSLKFDFQRVRPSACAFCQEKILEAQGFFRSDAALGMVTHKPAVPGHVLIIPVRHVERFEELTAEEMVALQEAIKKIDVAVRRVVGNKGYLLLQKNGKDAGQSVPHVHFHYLPATKFLAFRFFVSPWLKPLDAEEIEQIKNTFANAL